MKDFLNKNEFQNQQTYLIRKKELQEQQQKTSQLKKYKKMNLKI